MKKVTKKNTTAFTDYAKLINAKRVKYLKEIGHDFIETKRKGSYVFDETGKKYLDCHTNAGIFNFGRNHPTIIEGLRRGMLLADQGNFPIISRQKADLARRLADFLPGDLNCSLFSVMRGEAFEFACKLARGATGRPKLLAPKGSWFGQTGFALTVSERKDKELFGPLMPQMDVFPIDKLDKALAMIDGQTAAVLLEPIQVENGCKVFDKETLKAIRLKCNQVGALLVVDETQTGMGRTGTPFAFEKYGINPDMVLIGESLGGGMFPICATVFTDALNEYMNKHPLIHLSTFGGSDMGCIVASETIKLINDEKPWENASKIGDLFLSEAKKLAEKRKDVIRQANGQGLLLSLELKTAALAKKMCKALADNGVLALPGDVNKKSVILRPALNITEKEIKVALRAIDKAALSLKVKKPSVRPKKVKK